MNSKSKYFKTAFLTLVTIMMTALPSHAILPLKKPQPVVAKPAITEGVSWELAEYRKNLISDIRYDISFQIPEATNLKVKGEETISFRLSRKDDVVLDFRESADKIIAITANGAKCNAKVEREHIVIGKEQLRKGNNKINIRFIAGDQSLNRREGYVYTLFVPDRARTAFPCFDQPNMKGRFTLSLTVNKNWKAVTNTNQVSVTNTLGLQDIRSAKTIKFAETEPLSTYLFAFAAGDFQYKQHTEDGKTIGAYYRETDEKRVAQLPEIMHQVVYSLKWQEDFTGMPYPFAKYDLVILPGFQFGGMEHTGATFYNDTRLFLSENPTQDELLARTELIAHETSHMWFGDAVTMNWFDDVWTKEVFANYFAAEITNPLFPDIDHKLNWQKTYVSAAVSQDRTEGRTSIRQPLDNLRYAGLVYNNIIYNKAPVMMRKMVNIMGKDAFRSGIQEYLAKYKYGNATWDDLIAILDSKTPQDLKAFSKEWVDTPMWPKRKAMSALDGIDEDFYGYTELTGHQADQLFHNPSLTPSQRQKMLMNMYENYLTGSIGYTTMMKAAYLTAINDTIPLLASTAINYMYELMLSNSGFEKLEGSLWNVAKHHSQASRRAQIMRLLISRARSKSVQDSLYNAWEKQSAKDISERDYMTLAYELAVRMPEKADEIIAKQRARISDPDRQKQFDFISRAVSADEGKRDALFESFSQAENRRIEPWVQTSLYYLNHPLRDKASVKYIVKALELLPEIQRTGDIFFPQSWCSQLLAGHRCKEAREAVETYLRQHNDIHPMLKSKVLTAAHLLLK